jgi:hypothetical protein
MALNIQVVIYDSRDYILNFRDFNPKDKEAIDTFVWEWMKSPSAAKIEIKKWK